MPSDSVRCLGDVLVVAGKLEEAIRELRSFNYDKYRDLRRRRRDGAKPGEKRRNKHHFAPWKRPWRERWRNHGDDELEQARRDQAMYTRRSGS